MQISEHWILLLEEKRRIISGMDYWIVIYKCSSHLLNFNGFWWPVFLNLKGKYFEIHFTTSIYYLNTVSHQHDTHTWAITYWNVALLVFLSVRKAEKKQHEHCLNCHCAVMSRVTYWISCGLIIHQFELCHIIEFIIWCSLAVTFTILR